MMKPERQVPEPFYIPCSPAPAKGQGNRPEHIGQGLAMLSLASAAKHRQRCLLAAKEKGLMAIGVDVDQYNTYPEVKDALGSSAAKKRCSGVNYLRR